MLGQVRIVFGHRTVGRTGRGGDSMHVNVYYGDLNLTWRGNWNSWSEPRPPHVATAEAVTFGTERALEFSHCIRIALHANPFRWVYLLTPSVAPPAKGKPAHFTSPIALHQLEFEEPGKRIKCALQGKGCCVMDDEAHDDGGCRSLGWWCCRQTICNRWPSWKLSCARLRLPPR